MTEIVTFAGVDSELVEWIARLYGNADPKYRDRSFLSHLFLRNPAGPSLHAFALDDGQAVGHCCVVRTPARYGAQPLAAGKLEALWLDEPYRGRRADGKTIVRTLLDRLYAFSDEQGIELIHALATPEIGKVIAFTAVDGVGQPSLVSVIRPSRRGERAVAVPQRALLIAARSLAIAPRSQRTRAATGDDVDLVDAPLPARDCWTLVTADAWDWYCSSPLVRVLERRGRHAFRALVQLPGVAGGPLRLVGWRAEGSAVRSALTLLGELDEMARRTQASTLRFQPWGSAAGNGALTRACRLLAFVPRPDLTRLWVRSSDPAHMKRESIVSTPLFYLGF
jgi:hypothetical protein